MADFITSNKKKNFKRYLPKKTKVDLTPMVDLGFLLITFFIITTTMQEPKVMKLILPKDSKDSTSISELSTLTFIIKGKDSLTYYDGLNKEIKYAMFASMRSIIQRKQVSLLKNHINKQNLTIIIKPANNSSYKNFIDALDEVSINDCWHYFIDEPQKEEL